MEPFKTVTSTAAPIDMANVNTDQIFPARYIKKLRSEGYETFCFHDLRLTDAGAEKPDFVLNKPQYRNAEILVADADGSSRRPGPRAANARALARDLDDLSLGGSEFVVRYGPKSKAERFTCPPARCIHLFDASSRRLPGPGRTSVVDTVAEFVVESATGQIGSAIDVEAVRSDWPTFRSVGWFALSHPRRALEWRTATKLCQEVVAEWLSPITVAVAVAAAVTAYVPRMGAAGRFRQSWLGAALHPLGVLTLLAIQWYALARGLFGGRPTWKGRRYQ